MKRRSRRNVGVFGAGYVGLVTAACFAELGRTVTLVDVDRARVDGLRAGVMPIHEPGLAELVERNARAGRLRFSTEAADGVVGACAVFIAVGTPEAPDGRADLRAVREAALAIARNLDGPTVVVNKSTVPVETGDLVGGIIRAERRERHDAIVVSNPEFLREGSAIGDFMSPDRIVIGCNDPAAEDVMRALYAPLNAPVIVVDVHTAEMIKYTANAFLATKISFVNEIAAMCERVGADVKSVVAGVGADKRIGTAFFNPGLGFGGSCLPKDVSALRRIAEDLGFEPMLLDAVLAVNDRQVERIAARLAYVLDGLAGRTVGVLGLAFKPNTDDIRESPAIALIRVLQSRGASIRVHDPVAMPNARAVLGDGVAYAGTDDHHDAARGADALVLATEWNAYRVLDFERLRALMRRRVIFDARNALDPSAVMRAGFHYAGVGRAPRPVAVDELAG